MQDITFRMDKHKILLCNTGNYIQSPGINHNRKEYEKRMYTYTHIYK